LRVEVDKKNDTLAVEAEKEVVSAVSDPELEIGLKKARTLVPSCTLNDKVWVPFDGIIGRIEILRARQVIASRIRKVEADAIFNEFKSREGSIVLGVVHKCEHDGAVIKLDDVLAFLPRSLMVPGEKCMVGFSIRALLKEVLPEPRNDNQLILDRVSEAFLQQLFELEIPEVFERLVEIKKIVRIPGYKSKVVVSSNDRNIDPVGTCVGVGGSRIKPILKELGTEKIDIILNSDSREELVKQALKPAVINRVSLEEDTAHVWLDEDQRSLAIGKMGQNILLASRLTGFNIQLEQVEKGPSVEQVFNMDIQEESE
jgi:N utilization substance protein A